MSAQSTSPVAPVAPATPLPWTVRNDGLYPFEVHGNDGFGKLVCSTYSSLKTKEDCAANAAYLCAAANAYSQLVEALSLAPAPPNDGDFECEDGGRETERRWWANYSLFLESARAALALKPSA